MIARKKRFEQLFEAIKKRNGRPVNVRVVSATIESMGIREKDTKDDYGFDSIPDLAAYIYDILKNPKFLDLKNKNQLKEEKKEEKTFYLSGYIGVKQKLFIKEYGTGLIHLFPVFIQIAAIIVFGFSLWTFVGFNDLQSTAVVLGVILGFIFSGGFVKSIGKQVSFYWYNQDYSMAKKSVISLLKKGASSIFFVFLAGAILNFFLHLYPLLFVGIVFMYAFLIGSLLLSLAPLYIIKQRWILSVVITLATITALLLHFYTNLHVYFIHWLGISIAIIGSLLFLHFYFKKTIKANQESTNKIPKKMLSVYRNFNYFFYGLLLYLFVFIDRILAYSSTLDRNIPYVLYYDKDYEIGMDLAILVFFLLAGVLEYSVGSFSRLINYYQRKLSYQQLKDFNHKMKQTYFKHLRLFLISSLAIAVLLYFVVLLPSGYQAAFNEKLTNISLKVFTIGGLGYLFLSLGLLNVLYLFTLNQHQAPVKLLFIAFGINLIVGTFFSRMFSYEYSAVGLLVGAFVFMFMSTKAVLNYLNNLDYYYYAAY